MSLRVLLALFLIGVLTFSVLVIVLAAVFMRAQVGALLPPELALALDADLASLLAWQALGFLTASMLLLGVLYVVLNRVFIRPLNVLITAMETYMVDEKHEVLPDLSDAPKELQTLRTVFEGFRDRVETSHRSDTEVSRVKSDFISTAAHQLRTPLTAIRWALEALEKENLTESQKALVKSANDKGHDLVAIVGTLLDISSIESGKFQYKFAPMDVQELLVGVANDFGAFAAKNQVSLFYAREEGEGMPKVRADHDRVKWVLNNLVENAIQYTPAGGTVRISADVGGGRVYIRVRDTGIGIPHKDRANIFERFYRGSNAVSKENKGNGLGLYIARTIATDHGGDLKFVANEEGPGTTFVLSLPIAE